MADTCTVATQDVQVVSTVLGMASRAFGSYLGQVPGFGAAIEACGRLEAAAAKADLPEDPVSGIREIAIGHHELLRAYLDSGFDREEAFTLVHLYVQGAIMRGAHGSG